MPMDVCYATEFLITCGGIIANSQSSHKLPVRGCCRSY